MEVNPYQSPNDLAFSSPVEQDEPAKQVHPLDKILWVAGVIVMSVFGLIFAAFLALVFALILGGV